LTVRGGLVVICLAGTLVPAAAVAQEAGELTAEQRSRAVGRAVADIEPGSRLRVMGARGLLREGELLPEISVGRLRLLADTAAIDIPYARIDSLWHGRSKAGDGAVIGGAAGAAAGALLLLGYGELTCEAVTGGCGGPSTRGWVVFVGGGIAVGAAVGAIAGSEHDEWALVFP
jgi:hypothetical protein